MVDARGVAPRAAELNLARRRHCACIVELVAQLQTMAAELDGYDGPGVCSPVALQHLGKVHAAAARLLEDQAALCELHARCFPGAAQLLDGDHA